MKLPNLVAVALLLAAAVAPSYANPSQPTLTSDSVVVADDSFNWVIDCVVENPLDLGFFADSFFVELENQDPGLRRSPRITTQDLHALLATIQPISGGGKSPFQITLPAAFETGLLRFRLHGHNSAGPLPPLAMSVAARPGMLSTLFPSELVTAGAAKVEVVRVPMADAERPVPGVMLVAPEEGGARDLLRFAATLRSRGIASVIVSLPGCGTSSGTPDFAGPASIRALDAGWNALLHVPGVDPARLGAFGISQGGTAAAIWSAGRKDVRALALVGAYYDLWASARSAANQPLAAEIEARAGRDSASWRLRSPSRNARKLPGSVLILHGVDDPESPIASAREFAALAGKAGAVVQVRELERRPHAIGAAAVHTSVLPFFGSALAKTSSTNPPAVRR